MFIPEMQLAEASNAHHTPTVIGTAEVDAILAWGRISWGMVDAHLLAV